MKQLTLLVGIVFVALINTSFQDIDATSEIVKGKLVDSVSGVPIPKAYVYIISGEEEALSGNDGSFEITTWQKFPIAIQILHDRYRDLKVVYRKATDHSTIKLQLK